MESLYGERDGDFFNELMLLTAGRRPWKILITWYPILDVLCYVNKITLHDILSNSF